MDAQATLELRVKTLERRVKRLEGPGGLQKVTLQIQQLRGEMNARFSAHDERFDSLERKVEQKLDEGLGQLRTEMRTANDELRTEMRTLNDELRTEMRTLNEEVRTEMRVLHEEVIGRIALLGEGLPVRRRPARRKGSAKR